MYCWLSERRIEIVPEEMLFKKLFFIIVFLHQQDFRNL